MQRVALIARPKLQRYKIFGTECSIPVLGNGGVLTAEL